MSNEHYVPNGLIPSHPQAQQQYPYQFHPPSSMGSQTSLISQPKSFSSYQPVSNLGSPMNSTAGPGGVSSKRRCAHCGEALGTVLPVRIFALICTKKDRVYIDQSEAKVQ